MPSSAPTSGGVDRAVRGGPATFLGQDQPPRPGSALLRGLRFKTSVPAGPFDLEPKCHLWEILNSLLSLQQEAGL